MRYLSLRHGRWFCLSQRILGRIIIQDPQTCRVHFQYDVFFPPFVRKCTKSVSWHATFSSLVVGPFIILPVIYANGWRSGSSPWNRNHFNLGCAVILRYTLAARCHSLEVEGEFRSVETRCGVGGSERDQKQEQDLCQCHRYILPSASRPWL